MEVTRGLAIPTQVREVLKTAPDGLSATELARELGHCHKVVHYSLHNRMADAYIDRWRSVQNQYQRGKPVQHEAVWCLADIPEDCPRPEA